MVLTVVSEMEKGENTLVFLFVFFYSCIFRKEASPEFEGPLVHAQAAHLR